MWGLELYGVILQRRKVRRWMFALFLDLISEGELVSAGVTPRTSGCVSVPRHVEGVGVVPY